MSTHKIRVAAQNASDAFNNAIGSLQDALTECAVAIEEVVPPTTTEGEAVTLAKVAQELKEVKTKFDEVDWDAVMKASEFDPDEFIKTSDIDPDDFVKTDDLPDFDDFVKTDDLPDFDYFVKTDDLPDFSNFDPNDIESRLDHIEIHPTDELSDRIDEIEGRMESLEAPTDQITELETEVDNLSKKIEQQLVEANAKIVALELQVAEMDRVVGPIRAIFALMAGFSPQNMKSPNPQA